MYLLLKRICFSIALISPLMAFSQENATISRVPMDSTKISMNMDAVYDRPFLKMKNVPVAIGGFVEANSLYVSDAGVTEGLSFQARRLTLFMSASVSKRIKFLTEFGYESGNERIALDFAAMDIEFHPLLNFRGGVVLNPIGGFNQNHDGPKWEFIERPDVAAELLPATWSNVGFGVFGKVQRGNWAFGYEAYLTNGFDGSIIDSEANKTYLPATKQSRSRFEKSSNGQPLTTGKIAIKNRKIGEIGFSYMGGVYNQFQESGLTLDSKRRVDVVAVDFNTTIEKSGTFIAAEAAYITVDVPEQYTQQYGNKQMGGSIDVVQAILRRKMFGWPEASLNLACRFDYLDWNMGTFTQSNTRIGDERMAITPAISFRPSEKTVLRFNYRYSLLTDILTNIPSKRGAIMFGFSTYF